MLRFPVATHDPLLPQPRAAAGQRPAAMVHGGAAARATTSTRSSPRIAGRAPAHAGAARAPRDADGGDVACGRTDAGAERFDHVVLACHTRPGARAAGRRRAPHERAVLGAIRYQPNRAVLHTDASRAAAPPRAPGRPGTTSARAAGARRAASACTTCSTGCSRCRCSTPVIVSLNPVPSRRAGTRAWPSSTTRTRCSTPPPSRAQRAAARAAGRAAAPGSAGAWTRLRLPRGRPEVGPGGGRRRCVRRLRTARAREAACTRRRTRPRCRSAADRLRRRCATRGCGRSRQRLRLSDLLPAAAACAACAPSRRATRCAQPLRPAELPRRATTATAAPTRWLARRAAGAARASRRRRRGLAALLSRACWLRLQAGELLVLPPRRRRAARHRRRSATTPSASATATCCAARRSPTAREHAGAQGVPRLAVLRASRAATASASCVRPHRGGARRTGRSRIDHDDAARPAAADQRLAARWRR